MKRSHGVFWVFAMALQLAGCTGSSVRETVDSFSVAPSGVPALQLPFVLAYQSNRYGTLEPCGCSSKPYGGIDREANAIMGLRRKGTTLVYVDAGNGLAPKDASKRLAHYQAKAKSLVAMTNQMGLDAFAPGPTDYSLGLLFLKDLSAKAKGAWISSNVLWNGKPVFLPHRIVERNGLKVGILSVTKPGTVSVPGIEIADPERTLKAMVPELRKKADFVILLSQLETDADEQLAARIPGIDLIVGSDAEFSTEEPLWVKGKTLILETHIHGYLLGKLELDLKLPNAGFYSPEVIRKNREQLAQWEQALAKKPGDALAKSYVERIRADDSLEPVPNGTVYRHELIALDAVRFGTPNPVTKLVAKEKERVRRRAVSQGE